MCIIFWHSCRRFLLSGGVLWDQILAKQVSYKLATLLNIYLPIINRKLFTWQNAMGFRLVTVLRGFCNFEDLRSIKPFDAFPFVFRATVSICAGFTLFAYIGILVKGEGWLAPGVRNRAKIACDHVT